MPGVSGTHLLTIRHRLRDIALAHRDASPLPDGEVEADELYQDAGKKGGAHPGPGDPPRRRAD